ncbi:MAG: hypothetical protein KBF17_05820 [Candidatus Promineofilum sp.]|nr:hypothetical protein [Promineifilum sp.]MBP9657139.1 hypothetical protein [Promineifilum sp.]
MMRTPYVVGPPVKRPNDFFGRAGQASQFFDALAGPQAQCVSVLGLRRAGKTSFLQYVSHPEVMAAHLPDSNRYVMIYVDVSACKTSADFYTRVHHKLLNALPGAAAGVDRSRTTADVYTVESTLYEFSGRRVIFMMDEFDQLRTANFGDDFMVELRALAGVWDYELAYVTASYWDLFRLGKFVGLPPTSPFYNIFYPTPIYLSGLGPAELDELVKVPAGRVGVTADDDDVAYVRHIAGTLPFFVQAMAAVWLNHKHQRRKPDTREVTQRLVSEMGPYYEQWMRNFSDVEEDVLAAVAREQPVSRLPYEQPEIDEAVARLCHYGVLARTGDRLWPDSHLFDQWLQEYVKQVKRARPMPSALPSYYGADQPVAGAIPMPGMDLGERLVGIAEDVGQAIERDPESYHHRGDEALRDTLLDALRADLPDAGLNGAFATTNNSDILVRVAGRNVFVAECNTWHGQKAHLQTVDSLLGSLTGDNSSAVAVVIIRDREPSLIINAIVQAMPHHPGYLGFEGYRSGSRLAYRFHINGDPHREVDLSVLLIRLPD